MVTTILKFASQSRKVEALTATPWTRRSKRMLRRERGRSGGFGNIRGKCVTCARDCVCVYLFRLAARSWFSSRQRHSPSGGSCEGKSEDPAILAPLVPVYSLSLTFTRALLFLSLSLSLSRSPRLRISRAAPPGFFSFLFGATSLFSFRSLFFFFFCFAHPLTRAAGRFSQKGDTNGAIQI